MFTVLQEAGCDQLGDHAWIGFASKSSFKHHQLSGFNQSKLYVHESAVLSGEGSASYRTQISL